MEENKEYYSEQIMQSIDTIVKNNLNTVKFDRTEICTIVWQDENDSNKYLVTTKSGLSFKASVIGDNDISYSKGQQVYVLIQQGNYELERLIIGKFKENENDEVQLYTQPFDNFVSRNIVVFDDFENESIVLINSFDKYDYDTLCLGLWCTTSNISTGEYFIKIDFCNANGNSILTQDEKNLLTLSSKQIIGNPYQLIVDNPVLHLFPFEKFQKYLSNNDFKKIKITLDTSQLQGDYTNFSFDYVKLHFGYKKDIEKFNNDYVDLYLENPKDSYEYDSNSNKTISFDFYSIEDNDTNNYNWNQIINQNIIFNSSMPSINTYYYAYFLIYEPGYSKSGLNDIEESGTYWKTVKKIDLYNAQQPDFKYTINFSNYSDKNNVKFKVGIKDRNDEDFYIESNIVQFNNLEKSLNNLDKQSFEDTLYFTLENRDNDVFNNYGIDNKLIGSQISNNQKITVEIDGLNFYYCNPKTVTWKIPKIGSMITLPKKINSYTNQYYTIPPGWDDTNDYYYIYRNTNTDDAHTIEFGLSDQFNYTKTNNTISCEIEYDGIIYKGSHKFQFGTQSTSGSEYAFNIYPNRSGFLINNEIQPITFTAKLEDNEGKEISITENNLSVNWKIKNTTVQEGGATYTLYKSSITNFINFTILIAELQNFTDTNGNRINLTAYYPIQQLNSSNMYIEGPSRIIYDFQGSNPNYDKNPYKLFENGIEKKNISWEIIYEDNSISSFSNKKQNYPSLKDDNTLRPVSNLINSSDGCAIIVKDLSNNNIIFVQPLLILQNTYAFPLLNTWDQATYVDTNEGVIMSQLIGAGTKNSSNQYTGVLMGAINKTGSGYINGIYGFQNGGLRYKLDEKGSFYVGNTNSDCYISFNEGVTGRSTSDELVIKANKFTLNTNNLTINSEATGNNSMINFKDKFKVLGNGNATIAGWDIETNRIKHVNEISPGQYTNLTLSTNPGEPALYLTHSDVANALFRLDWSGNIICNTGTFDNVTVSGIINADSGLIGGWNIDSTCLQKTISNYTFEIRTDRASDQPALLVQYIPTRTYKWYVRPDGYMYADTAEIHGSIYADGGKIGGWNINGDSIYHIHRGTDNHNFLTQLAPQSGLGLPVFMIYKAATDGDHNDWIDIFHITNEGNMKVRNIEFADNNGQTGTGISYSSSAFHFKYNVPGEQDARGADLTATGITFYAGGSGGDHITWANIYNKLVRI